LHLKAGSLVSFVVAPDSARDFLFARIPSHGGLPISQALDYRPWLE